MATVILLDCDQLEPELAGRAPASGLLPLSGRPLVRYAAEAFRLCGDIDKVVLAGPTVYAPHASLLTEVDETMLSDSPIEERVEAVLDRFADESELLFWPANGPLIRPETVEQFLEAAPVGAGVCWSLVRAERFQQTYPQGTDVPRHALGGEEVVVGSLGLVNPRAVAPQRELLRRVLRKEFGRGDLLRMLGVGFAIKFQAGRAGLEELTRRISEVLRLDCLLAILPQAELAFRVRSRSEHHLARACLEGE